MTDLTDMEEPFEADAEPKKRKVISSGNGELDSKMGGGIPAGSLTLIEGSSGAGKSVLVQQVTWGSLQDGFTVKLFTSENTVRSLIEQMASLDLDVLDYLLLARLRVYPMELAHLGAQAPARLLEAMRSDRRHDVIIIDSLTLAIAHSTPNEIVSFFEECKRLSARGTTVMLVLHDSALSGDLLVRIRSMCDVHLQLRTDDDGKKLIKTLEVTKVRGGDSATGNIVSFDVEPGWGMRVVPVSKVKG